MGEGFEDFPRNKKLTVHVPCVFGKMVIMQINQIMIWKLKKKTHRSVTESHLNYTKVLKCSSEQMPKQSLSFHCDF